MWIKYDRDADERYLFYWTIDVYRTVNIIRHQSSPMTLYEDYDPMWTAQIFYAPMVF
jgi:hypothetical protein